MSLNRLMILCFILTMHIHNGLCKHRRHHRSHVHHEDNPHVSSEDHQHNDQDTHIDTPMHDEPVEPAETDEDGDTGDTSEGSDAQPSAEETTTVAATTTVPAAPAAIPASELPDSACDTNQLNACLGEQLDEWSKLLYGIKENVVMIEEKDCEDVRMKIKKCIETDAVGWKCNHANVVQIASQVTDLLLHKKDSGSWLRSYYVTAYVCEDAEGKTLRTEISADCLKHEKISETTLEGVGVMDQYVLGEGLKNYTNTQRCEFLKKQLTFLRKIGNSRCTTPKDGENAGKLMCETGKLAFLKMHPNLFHNGDKCEFNCRDEVPTTAPGPDLPSDGPAQPSNGQTDASNGSGDQTTDGQTKTASHSFAQSIANLLLALTAAMLASRLQTFNSISG